MKNRAMRYFIFAYMLFFISINSNATANNLNEGWKFSLVDTNEAIKADFDDSNWRSLNLPHDWAFENGYSKDGMQKDKGGYLGGGIGWYRKKINLTANDVKNKKIYIGFDAIYMNSKVWINGKYVGERPYGYISFEHEISNFVHKGENTIAIRVDNSLEPSARWYHGCGVYGNAYLLKKNQIHFKTNATFITTPFVSRQQAEICVKTELTAESKGRYKLEYEILDATKKSVARFQSNTDVAKVIINNPNLWSPQSPYLYTLKASLLNGKQTLDKIEIPFGIRDVKWDSKTGFWLNNENIKLRGVCEHLEAGPVGAMWTEKLMRWKIGLLKDMGCNAIRTAHNPQLPMFYDICDQMGIMVLDEAFDGWNKKADYDYGMQAFAQWWERDLRDFIRRDRNHPCVIAYSVGNETGGAIGKDLVRVCHEEDSTRLVTSGDSSTGDMDILGVNGRSETPVFLENQQKKNQAFIATEAPHTWQTRAYYRAKTWYRDGKDLKNKPFITPDLTPDEVFTDSWYQPGQQSNKKQVFNSSYDNAYVRMNARQGIEALNKYPWYAGQFRWTGFDYLGEAGYVHGGWPFRLFMGGAIDLAGFPKDLYYLYQSQWTDKDMVHILPHWTHYRVRPGTLIPIQVYTTGDEAELFLNDKSLGRLKNGKNWEDMAQQWLVPWQEGKLSVVAYRSGQEIARNEQQTADAPAKIKITTDVDNGTSAKWDDVIIATFEQQDKNGILNPYGENRIYTKLIGSAQIISLESGNPIDVESNFEATSKRAFYGLLRGFVKPTAKEGTINLISATICGDKSLHVSSQIYIDVQNIQLRKGKDKKEVRTEIFYTSDGSSPNRSSMEYKTPFTIEGNTKIRAAIYMVDELIMEMEEDFGDSKGVHWGNREEATHDPAKEYAVNARINSGQIINYAGAQCVDLTGNDASLAWYQENDGVEKEATLILRYTSKSGDTVPLDITNNKNKLIISKSKRVDDYWSEITAKIIIHKGANNIELKGKGVIVNYIKITE